MALASNMLRTIGYIALFHRVSVATDQRNAQPLAKSEVAAFAFNRRSSHQQRPRERGPSELRSLPMGQRNPLLELVVDIALGRGRGRGGSAGSFESVWDFDVDLAGEIQEALSSAGLADAVADNANDVTGTTRKKFKRRIVRPPIVNRAPRSAAGPSAHTALARVVSNQLGVDLSSVSPPSPGGRITAADVEFHAWRMSQPPCSAEVLELAYSLGLDLNTLYDGDELQVSDVKLYQENARSLKMSSQAKKGAMPTSEKARKKSALDKRMERNIGKLSQNAIKLAGTLAESIVKQVQLHTQNGVFEDMKDDKVAGGIMSVEEIDASLAGEISEALSGTIFLDRVEDGGGVDAPLAHPKMEELRSMTCVQLKGELRARGLKVSGRKAELVNRLFDAGGDDDADNKIDHDGIGCASEGPPFYTIPL